MLANVSAIMLETEGTYGSHQQCNPTSLFKLLLGHGFNVSYWPKAFYRDAALVGLRTAGGLCPGISHPEAAFGPPTWGGDDELIRRPTAPQTNCSVPLKLVCPRCNSIAHLR